MVNSPFDRPARLLEPLTRREREILVRLAGDLYNREIAEALTLAPSSIKWYIRQIYAKLGVTSRQEAIRRAGDLGLLDLKTSAFLRSNNLPVSLTPFIGRLNDLEHIRSMLADPAYRLVTLTGAGGVGKTRTALRLANELQGTYPQGAWLVELAALTKPELLPQSVAAVFELRPDRDRSILTVLTDYLRTRKLLLVMDNCEHLVAACASLANTLLQVCPDLRILATSREALEIEGEIVYRLPSMTFPETGEQVPLEQLVKYEAVELFTRRARVALAGFELTEENAGAVAQICQHLDGIPLALELAAAQVRILDVEQIASQLDDRFRLLVGGDRTALPRLQTMRASIDWSYQLLSEDEKALFERLSVFAGGCTLAAAKAVCADDMLPESDILGLLGQLVDKSLVLVIRKKGREIRYQLLETVRQYAAGKLVDAGETDRTRNLHLEYFFRLAKDAEPNLYGPDQSAWWKRLEAQHDNFRIALEWSLESGGKQLENGFRLAGELCQFWHLSSNFSEGTQWLKRLLASDKDKLVLPRVRAKALTSLGWLMGLNLELESPSYSKQALSYIEESLAINRQLGDKQGIGYALRSQWIILDNSQPEDLERCRRVAEEGLALFQETGDKFGISDMISYLAHTAVNKGDLDKAKALYEKALPLKRELGNKDGVAFLSYALGRLEMSRRNYPRARGFFQESLSIWQELGFKEWGTRTTNALTELALNEKDWDQAAVLAEQSLVNYRERGDRGGMIVWLLLLAGNAELGRCNCEKAKTRLMECLCICKEIGDQFSIAHTMQTMAGVAVLQGQYERAAQLFGIAESLHEDLHIRRKLYQHDQLDRDIATLRLHLAEPDLTAAWSAGRSMTFEETLAYALDDKLKS